MAELLKECCCCKFHKPLSDFTNDKQQKDGLRRSCRECERVRAKDYYRRNRDRVLAQSKKAHKKQRLDPKYREKEKLQRSQKLIKRYGITIKQYDKMFEEQNGLCAICGEPQKSVHGVSGVLFRLVIDHNHKTGKVRGLLCSMCNIWLGVLEKKSFCKKAKKYLGRH